MADEKVTPKIVEAVGLATHGAYLTAEIVEKAMNDAVQEASEEAKKIWEDETVSAEDRKKKVDALLDTKALLARKMDARARVKREAREQQAADIAAAQPAEELTQANKENPGRRKDH